MPKTFYDNQGNALGVFYTKTEIDLLRTDNVILRAKFQDTSNTSYVACVNFICPRNFVSSFINTTTISQFFFQLRGAFYHSIESLFSLIYTVSYIDSSDGTGTIYNGTFTVGFDENDDSFNFGSMNIGVSYSRFTFVNVTLLNN